MEPRTTTTIESQRSGGCPNRVTHAVPPPATNLTWHGCMEASRLATHIPCQDAAMASTMPSHDGKALSHTEATLSMARTTSAAEAIREARHSMRQLDDSLDKGMQLRVIGAGLSHAPLPELIVLAFEQA